MLKILIAVLGSIRNLFLNMKIKTVLTKVINHTLHKTTSKINSRYIPTLCTYYKVPTPTSKSHNYSDHLGKL